MRRSVWLGVIVAAFFAAPSGTILAQQAQTQTMCPAVVTPVCATKSGRLMTYNNDCEAQRDGAHDIKAGKCPAVAAEPKSGY
jgi:hypothetical protein